MPEMAHIHPYSKSLPAHSPQDVRDLVELTVGAQGGSRKDGSSCEFLIDAAKIWGKSYSVKPPR